MVLSTIAQLGADGYTVTRNGEASPKVACDGNPNAPVNGTVTTCTKSGSTYELENTREGKPVSNVKIEGILPATT